LQSAQSSEPNKEQFAETVKESIVYEVEKDGTLSPKEKGDNFDEWALTRLFDAGSSEVRNQIVDGSNDMGIDAYLIPDSGGRVQLFQCKYNESHSEAEILGFQENVRKFLKKNLNDIKREDLKILCKRIKDEELEPELFYITNKKVDFTKKTRKLKVFGIDQIVDQLWLDISGIPPNKTETIHLKQQMPYERTIVGIVSIEELKKFINSSRTYIFESNIRKYLRNTKINKGLYKTLRDRASDLFYFNNGITIVAKKFKVNGNDVELIEPQIVNGAQTSSTIDEYLELMDPVQGDLLLTIIETTSIAERQEITQYRNSQNSVKGLDLISLNSLHANIKLQLREVHYFYEQQAGAWNFEKKLNRNGLQWYTGHDIYNKYLPSDHDHHIEAKHTIQAMVAGIYQNPTKPYSSVSSFLPNGTLYDKVFDDILAHNYRNFLYPYLIEVYGTILGYGDRKAEKELKKFSKLMFVTVYFYILFGFILNKNKDEIRANPEIMDRIFLKFDVNKKLLDICDTATNFFLDIARVWLNEHKDVTPNNFFSHYAWDAHFQQAINGWILDNKKEEIKAIRNSI
jgi:hypothetical protein